MRVLTFQSERVIRKVLEDGLYYADPQLSREKRDYSKDIAQLGETLPNGKVPIWCYVPVNGNEFEASDFLDGILFERFRCEMSLNTSLSVLPMIELEVPKDMLYTGFTHNCYAGAKVFPYISREMLIAVYRLSFDTQLFYPKVLIASSYSDSLLFPEGFMCSKQD